MTNQAHTRPGDGSFAFGSCSQILQHCFVLQMGNDLKNTGKATQEFLKVKK